MIQKIENITFSILNEGGNTRVKLHDKDIIFSNQNTEVIIELIKYNFNIVSNHYKIMIKETKEDFNFDDIHNISITIVLHYLYMYNSWRTMYKKQENRDLKFNEIDFNNPSTHDIVFDYFKKKYINNNWEEKCSVLFGMELDELKAYYRTREAFYNK